ncbi:hypothetical protein ACOCJ7_09485 [Knoellia sp. CPCC 206453]|uniref:hypothetical protein n=1 Tax=Knoellia pratensis TaxID=3404796 RepID=UPI00361AC797
MSTITDIIDKLQGVLADLQDIDLWPPWDAAQTIVDLIGTMIEIATEAPDPAPTDVDDAAAAWRRLGRTWSSACTDVGRTSTKTTIDIWEGDAGNGYRSSLTALVDRMDSVEPATGKIDTALGTLSTKMTDARKRHGDAWDELNKHTSISWGDLWPWELKDYIAGILRAVVHGAQELLGAYQDANSAITTAARDIRNAVDELELPHELPDGVSPVSGVNLFIGGGDGNDSGPLRGNVVERANAAMAAMTPEERAAAQRLLANAPDDTSRGCILAAIAAGATGATLLNYSRKLGQLSDSERKGLDPTAHPGVFGQPDLTTCGSSSLLLAKMLNDPLYAMQIMTGYDPRTGQQVGDPGAVDPNEDPWGHNPTSEEVAMHNRFQHAAIEMHHQTNGLTTHDGNFNGWWPEAAGTSPGSAARQMSGDGGSGTGGGYETRYVDPDNAGETYDRIARAADNGQAVPVYTYDIDGGNAGAHVVLVTGTEDGNLRVYNPGSGETTITTREDFDSRQLSGSMSWDKPLVAILPPA